VKSKFYEELSDLFDLPIYLFTQIAGGYLVHKFDMVDDEVRPVASYNMGMGQCTCPAYDPVSKCKHIFMAKGEFHNSECSGEEAEEHLTVFTERFMGEDFAFPIAAGKIKSVSLEIPGSRFEKSYKKGLRMVAGTKKLNSGLLGILLKFTQK
jgi:hypothetical protein